MSFTTENTMNPTLKYTYWSQYETAARDMHMTLEMHDIQCKRKRKIVFCMVFISDLFFFKTRNSLVLEKIVINNDSRERLPGGLFSKH